MERQRLELVGDEAREEYSRRDFLDTFRLYATDADFHWSDRAKLLSEGQKRIIRGAVRGFCFDITLEPNGKHNYAPVIGCGYNVGFKICSITEIEPTGKGGCRCVVKRYISIFFADEVLRAKN